MGVALGVACQERTAVDEAVLPAVVVVGVGARVVLVVRMGGGHAALGPAFALPPSIRAGETRENPGVAAGRRPLGLACGMPEQSRRTH